MEICRIKCPGCGSEVIIDKEPTIQLATQKPFVVCKNKREHELFFSHKNEKERRSLTYFAEKMSECNTCILLKKVGNTYEIDSSEEN